MMSRYVRTLTGLAVAGVLAVPALAAPAKKAPKKPAKPPAKRGAKAKGDAKAGKTAFKSEGCTGCHKTADYKDGGNVGPDLSKVGGEKSTAEIAKYIRHPKAGSVMPASKAPEKTVNDIAAYLSTQK